MDKQHQRDLLEIKQTIEVRMRHLDSAGFDKTEIAYRKQECEILLKRLSKIHAYRRKPIETITTVHGTTFKIGDKFNIAGDTVSTYKIVMFPDSVTIRGVSSNPAIGKPYTCEVYVESAFKVKKEKSAKKVKEKKRKPVKIKVGEYFALRTNNTIFKAIEVTKNKVIGTNELTAKNAPKRVKTSKTEIQLKTKKEYKKQRKAKVL